MRFERWPIERCNCLGLRQRSGSFLDAVVADQRSDPDTELGWTLSELPPVRRGPAEAGTLPAACPLSTRSASDGSDHEEHPQPETSVIDFRYIDELA